MTTHKKSGRKRALIAGGTLLGVVALATSALFYDAAYLNLGGGGTGQFAVANNFDIKVVNTNSSFDPVASTVAGADAIAGGEGWQDADQAEGVPFNIAGSDAMVPGNEALSVAIPVKNVSTKLGAKIKLSVVPRTTGTPTPVNDAILVNALRFDVIYDGATLLSGVPATSISSLNLATLPKNGGNGVLTIKVVLPDTADNNQYLDKKAAFQAIINAESV